MRKGTSNSRNALTMEWMVLAVASAAFALLVVDKLAAAPLMNLADTTAASIGALDVYGDTTKISLMQN